MKLTKLYIHNYKSFYDTTIELDKMNIVVGENNSGKSNLIDVLEFIDISIKKDLFQAVIEKGGFEKLFNYNYDEKFITIEIKLENDLFLIKSRFSINEKVSVTSAIIYAKNREEDTVFPLEIKGMRFNKELKIKQTRDSRLISKNILKLDDGQKLFMLDPRYHHLLSFISRTYVFNTENIRNQSHKKATTYLEKDGSNLGRNLLELKSNNPEEFETISNSMIGIVNEIDGIDVQETFGNYLIGFNEKNKQVGIDTVSDGTINLLATMTALNQPKNMTLLLAFDEPERYLHLKAINYLLENFRASDKQILITTHSTEILKYANLDEVVFIYRDADGDTQSIRATDIPDLEGKMERLGYERPLTLDELIATNIIGNFE
ncbi:MAG TPA: hypothetical protein ENK99_01760 [Campylobacterales bacterium]|nr:hypothetical protein [Arcobacter sp.]HHD80325.1 hypothetical protein [Campylobacterales bacterium]